MIKRIECCEEGCHQRTQARADGEPARCFNCQVLANKAAGVGRKPRAAGKHPWRRWSESRANLFRSLVARNRKARAKGPQPSKAGRITIETE